MEKKVKEILKYVVSLAVAALLLYFSFRDVEWSNFMAGVRACRGEFVLLSMAFGLLSFWLRSLRWRQIILPIDPSTGRLTCLNAVNVSYLVNTFLPRVGEFVACGYVNKHSEPDPATGRRKATMEKLVGTAVVDRVWDIIFLLVPVVTLAFVFRDKFGAFFGRLFGDGFSQGNFPWWLPAIVLLAALFVLTVRALRDRIGVCAKIWNVLSGMWQGAVACFSGNNWWKCMIFTAMVWGCYWMTSASIVWAVQGMDTGAVDPGLASTVAGLQDLGMNDALLLMLAGALSSLVPVPGGFGAFHYVVCLALSSIYGVPKEVGIIFATLSHESQVIIQIICGGCSYIWETLRPGRSA